MKQIKIENNVHKKLAQDCPKSKTYGEYIDDLLAGEPFIDRLKEQVAQATKSIEDGKKAGHINPTEADALIRVCNEIIDICERRSKVESA